MRSRVLFVALVLSFAGCKKEDERAARSEAEAAAEPKAAEAPKSAEDGPLPWIHDDYPAALARARGEKKPVVVDLWAAWCHTCLSMQQTVLRDPSLAELAGRFVWASLDTEKPENAEALADLPVEVWPTFYVVSPEDGFIQARQLGATGVAGFREFLLQGERGHLAARGAAGDLAGDEKLVELRAANQAAAASDFSTAAKHYGKALAAAPEGWDRTSDVLVLQISALARAGDHVECAELGKSRLADAARAKSAAAADFVYWAHGCGSELRKFDLAGFRARATETIEAVLADEAAPLSTDDRSEALRILREMAVSAKDEEAAQAFARRQKTLLDQAVATARSPLEAMTYAYHRAEVYGYLGNSAELVPWLEELTETLPQQYDPPYRLAGVLADLERHDEAAKAAALAAERAPDGPRKTRILTLLAEIHAQRGDQAAQRAALEAAVAAYAALPASQKRPKAEAKARAALAALPAK